MHTQHPLWCQRKGWKRERMMGERALQGQPGVHPVLRSPVFQWPFSVSAFCGKSCFPFHTVTVESKLCLRVFCSDGYFCNLSCESVRRIGAAFHSSQVWWVFNRCAGSPRTNFGNILSIKCHQTSILVIYSLLNSSQKYWFKLYYVCWVYFSWNRRRGHSLTSKASGIYTTAVLIQLLAYVRAWFRFSYKVGIKPHDCFLSSAN